MRGRERNDTRPLVTWAEAQPACPGVESSECVCALECMLADCNVTVGQNARSTHPSHAGINAPTKECELPVFRSAMKSTRLTLGAPAAERDKWLHSYFVESNV